MEATPKTRCPSIDITRQHSVENFYSRRCSTAAETQTERCSRRGIFDFNLAMHVAAIGKNAIVRALHTLRATQCIEHTFHFQLTKYSWCSNRDANTDVEQIRWCRAQSLHYRWRNFVLFTFCRLFSLSFDLRFCRIRNSSKHTFPNRTLINTFLRAAVARVTFNTCASCRMRRRSTFIRFLCFLFTNHNIKWNTEKCVNKLFHFRNMYRKW